MSKILITKRRILYLPCMIGVSLGLTVVAIPVVVASDSCGSNEFYAGGCTGRHEEKNDAVGGTITINADVAGHVYGAYADRGAVKESSVVLNGGTITGQVFGGWTAGKEATGNSITINDGTVKGDIVSGGGSIFSSSSDNTVTVNGGHIKGSVLGGNTARMGKGAAGNRVIINGGIVEGSVYGGCTDAPSQKTDNNTVTIAGNPQFGAETVFYGGNRSAVGNILNLHTAGIEVKGVKNFSTYNLYASTDGTTLTTAESVDVSNSTVNLVGLVGDKVLRKGETLTLMNNIRGDALSYTGMNGIERDAGNNTLRVYDLGAEMSGSEVRATVDLSLLAGGRGNGNSLHLTAQNVKDETDIAGGYADGGTSKTATGNSVVIDEAVMASGLNLYGGFCKTGADCSDLKTGNSLNLAGRATVNGAKNFSTYNLYVPSDGGGAVLTTQNAVDLKDATVNLLGVTGTTKLSPGTRVPLMSRISNFSDGTYKGQGVQQTLVQRVYDFTFDNQNNALTATVDAVREEGVNPQGGDTPSGRAATTGILVGAGDFVANEGLREAISAIGLGAAGLSAGDERHVALGTFAVMTGGRLRYSSGHTTVDSLSLLGGISADLPISVGQVMVGAFAEMGWGNYRGNSGDVQGRGNARYFGGGILGRYEVDGIYIEGTGRMGQVENNYTNTSADPTGHVASYETTSPYYAVHTGLGYLLPVTEAVNVDLSTKYFWTHQSGNNVNIFGDDVRFAAADSHRWKTGARVNVAVGVDEGMGVDIGIAPYVGAYYEHEFDGSAKATIAHFDVLAPSLKGGTGIAELGVTLGSPANSLKLDIGVQGYAGKRQGVTGSLKVNWTF